jgi:hypothetical protein
MRLKTRNDRRTITGLALVVGGLLFLAFWLPGVTESDFSIGAPRALQLVIHGGTIALLSVGLLLAATERPWGRTLSVTGAAVAIVGLVSYLWVFASGLLLMGAAEVLDRRHRLAGSMMTAGSLVWILFWVLGARFDSEDSLPLSDFERVLATTGLMLIAGGIIALGFAQFRLKPTETATATGASS